MLSPSYSTVFLFFLSMSFLSLVLSPSTLSYFVIFAYPLLCSFTIISTFLLSLSLPYTQTHSHTYTHAFTHIHTHTRTHAHTRKHTSLFYTLSHSKYISFPFLTSNFSRFKSFFYCFDYRTLFYNSHSIKTRFSI